jgi:xylulokinase
MAGRAPPGSGGVIFTPWLYGERTPVEDRFVRGGFHNLSLSASREDLVRAVFEGVAFNTRWLLRAVERFTRRLLEPIGFTGGGGSGRVVPDFR